MAEQEIVLREWAAEWFHIHVEGKLAPNTEGGYRNLIFNHIIPRLGGVALTNLSEKRIGYWSGQDWSISVSKTSAIPARFGPWRLGRMRKTVSHVGPYKSFCDAAGVSEVSAPGQAEKERMRPRCPRRGRDAAGGR